MSANVCYVTTFTAYTESHDDADGTTGHLQHPEPHDF